MRFRHSIAIIVALAMFPAIPARAEQPAIKPTVPALIVGTSPPKSWMARGIFRLTATDGLAFHVATDGQRQVCALYDPADGTPLFLSDGQQTLVYDLVNSRVLRVPISRGNIRVDWDEQDEKPLRFRFGVEFKSKPEKLDEANAWFRIDRFVDSTRTLQRLPPQDNAESFATERKGGSVESLQLAPGDRSWFRFTSMSGGEDFYRLELHVTAIDQQLPGGALAFPDLKRLPDDVHLTDLDQQALPMIIALLSNGRAWMAKMALAGGPQMRESAGKVMGDVDWPQLRERDERFGAAYRKALAEQGVELPTYPTAGATRATR